MCTLHISVSLHKHEMFNNNCCGLFHWKTWNADSNLRSLRGHQNFCTEMAVPVALIVALLQCYKNSGSILKVPWCTKTSHTRNTKVRHWFVCTRLKHHISSQSNGTQSNEHDVQAQLLCGGRSTFFLTFTADDALRLQSDWSAPSPTISSGKAVRNAKSPVICEKTTSKTSLRSATSFAVASCGEVCEWRTREYARMRKRIHAAYLEHHRFAECICSRPDKSIYFVGEKTYLSYLTKVHRNCQDIHRRVRLTWDQNTTNSRCLGL